MYPLGSGLTFARNQWYIGALSSEVGRTLIERRILGKLLVFFRKEDGTAIALDGLCPHRLYPLAQSRLVGDAITCGYHGFTFGSDGKCLAIPGQAKVPAAFSTGCHTLVERPPFIWVWTGEADKADEALLPDQAKFGIRPGFRHHMFGVDPLKARYPLLIENLFDLTHFNFIHAPSASANNLYETPIEIRQEECLTTARTMLRRPLSHFDKVARGEAVIASLPEPALDALNRSIMFCPGLVVTTAESWQARGFGDDEKYVNSIFFIHGITPETETSTHYFNGIAYDICLDDEDYLAMWTRLNASIVQEDITALEAIEARIPLERDTGGEISSRADNGGLLARRFIQDAIRREQMA